MKNNNINKQKTEKDLNNRIDIDKKYINKKKLRKNIKLQKTKSHVYQKITFNLRDESGKVEKVIADIFDEPYNNIPLKAIHSNELESSELFITNKDKKYKFTYFIIILLVILFLADFSIFKHVPKSTKEEPTEIIENVINENIVFVGDSITNRYNVKNYFTNKNVVKSGVEGYKTEDILDNMYDMIYKYNPSKIFLLIGTNDISQDEISEEEVIDNIKRIIENVKKNKPYCRIYVESIYPVNHSSDEKIKRYFSDIRDNRDIRSVNNKIKELCKKEKVTFINLYKVLQDENGELKIDYTIDGLHISDDGYKVISKSLLKYM